MFTSILFLGGFNIEVTSNQPKLIEFGEDAQNALEIFYQYRAELNNSLSRSGNDVTILDVDEMDIPVKLDNSGAGVVSRTTNTEQVKLHRITFSHEGEKGLTKLMIF